MIWKFVCLASFVWLCDGMGWEKPKVNFHGRNYPLNVTFVVEFDLFRPHLGRFRWRRHFR